MPKRQRVAEPVIPEQARAFFSDPSDWYCFIEGIWDEWRSCNFMRAKVIAPGEKAAMIEMGLTLEDMMNGRFAGDYEARVDELFEAWNQRLGYKLYGF